MKQEEKQIAYGKYKRALKNGTLVRQPCIVCGDIQSDGHHEDYGKPLEVVWLCRVHHRRRHFSINRGQPLAEFLSLLSLAYQPKRRGRPSRRKDAFKRAA